MIPLYKGRDSPLLLRSGFDKGSFVETSQINTNEKKTEGGKKPRNGKLDILKINFEDHQNSSTLKKKILNILNFKTV